VRKLCKYCKIECETSNEDSQNFDVKKGDKIYSALGCSKCSGTGYKGRTVVYELLKLDSNHKSIIAKSGISDELWLYCSENSSGSCRESCKALVRSGVTSIDEFINATYSYNFK
jgi:type IV pilus assembly protein PilB